MHIISMPLPNSCPMELKSGFFHDIVKSCAQAEQKRLWILILLVKIPLEFVSI